MEEIIKIERRFYMQISIFYRKEINKNHDINN